jgi:hydroxymethylglutaryl-CoA reductase (NADPH)
VSYLDKLNHAQIPMYAVGPIKIISQEIDAAVRVPLATYETPLWPSTNRGAKVSRLSGGIQAVVLRDHMTRSVLVEAPSNVYALKVIESLKKRTPDLEAVVTQTSRFANLLEWHFELVGNLMYVRFAMTTGDASGHNMVTKGAESLLEWMLIQYQSLKYVSISGNYCIDKKVSAVNGILGRGKSVVAEICIPRTVCLDVLKTTPEKIVDLNIKKNLIGTTLAGGLRTANAHFANMLLAFYLAMGQDAANIIEGSQGIVHTQMQGTDLYFSVSLPNIIVGTIGNGKQFSFVQDNLKMLGCLEEGVPGHNGRRLAVIMAATVLCGELSLIAAQTNPGELMRCHHKMERKVSEFA